MMASFSKIEVGHPLAQWPARFESVKPPELCQNQADRLQSQIDIEKNPDRREYLRMVKEVRFFFWFVLVGWMDGSFRFAE